MRVMLIVGVLFAWFMPAVHAEDGTALSAALQKWLVAQDWRRDTDGPVVSLGPAGAFDDQHLFSPWVIREDGTFSLWYSASRGEVDDRVNALGLATSSDGRTFAKHAANPVLRFADGRRSALTPTVLRGTDGAPLREGGQLRMWFSATDFRDSSKLHTLHESRSADGIAWSEPSEPLLEHVYSPSIVKDGDRYCMWYTDVSREPWVFRHAASDDGRRWQVTPAPVMVVDQPWERGRLFYPCVVQHDGIYLMWYGSYWSQHLHKTALGFAVSEDGITWHKHPQNPVLRPEESRPWESHYTTSHSVMRLDDGTWRIWYATRKKPPHVNKYFAIATAVWTPPHNGR